MKNVYEIGENKWNIFSELVQVHKTDASMYAHLFSPRAVVKQKKNQECYCSKCVWIRGSYYCYFFLKKIVKSFEKEPWKSRILVPKKNIALRETFIIIRFPDVYDVDS